MHGHERTVERKIRLWVAQQEHDRRKEGELGLVGARGGAADGMHMPLTPAKRK